MTPYPPTRTLNLESAHFVSLPAPLYLPCTVSLSQQCQDAAGDRTTAVFSTCSGPDL